MDERFAAAATAAGSSLARDTGAAEDIALRDGQLRFWPRAVAPALADQWFSGLNDELAWHQEQLRLYGRWVKVPREVAWHGDAGATYRYSGKTHNPEPWTATLAEIRSWLTALTGHPVNSVLGNRYRDGQDAMGWHADNEPELGPEPAIVSLNLGATRRMRFRRTDQRRDTFHLDLPGGSVLVMSGPTQQHWQHCITRTAKPVAPRINLTFRLVRGRDEVPSQA
ncbi:MAG: alpha-ketoglutarate-dependent dioxygenase AlkB [Pseudomonadota bacterium]